MHGSAPKSVFKAVVQVQQFDAVQCVCLCAYAYVCAYVCAYACAYVCAYVCPCVCACVFACVSLFVYAWVLVLLFQGKYKGNEALLRCFLDAGEEKVVKFVEVLTRLQPDVARELEARETQNTPRIVNYLAS